MQRIINIRNKTLQLSARIARMGPHQMTALIKLRGCGADVVGHIDICETGSIR